MQIFFQWRDTQGSARFSCTVLVHCRQQGFDRISRQIIGVDTVDRFQVEVTRNIADQAVLDCVRGRADCAAICANVERRRFAKTDQQNTLRLDARQVANDATRAQAPVDVPVFDKP